MFGFLEFYFFVIIFQLGIPVNVAEHTYKHLNVCRYAYSVMLANAVRDNNSPESKKKGLHTVVAPPDCAQQKSKSVKQESKGVEPRQEEKRVDQEDEEINSSE